MAAREPQRAWVVTPAQGGEASFTRQRLTELLAGGISRSLRLRPASTGPRYNAPVRWV